MYKGGVICDYLNRKHWAGMNVYQGLEPLQTMANNGMNSVRVGVTMNSVPQYAGITSDELKKTPWTAKSWSCLEYAEQILREADKLGMKKNLFFFLSDEAAHGDAQKTPLKWQNMSIEEMGEKLCEYTYATTKYYLDMGISIDIYEIGNEIERGILDYRPMEKVDAPNGDKNQFWNVEFYNNKIWNIEALLLKKAIDGVKKANPNAVICLHIAGVGWSEGDIILKSFYDAMDKFGVQYDLIGLSYYWVGILGQEDQSLDPYFENRGFLDALDYLAARGKKIIISEWAYPNNQFGTLCKCDKGYPYTYEGQAMWVRKFLAFCKDNPHIIGSFYFYPEYYMGFSNGGTDLLESCGLFINPESTTIAIREFI